MKACYIVGAGECSQLSFQIKEEDLVIAADGGYQYLEGMRVDLLIGDFDSISHVPDDVKKITLPVEKDDTDMLAAIKEGMQRGYREFHLYGGFGGRVDHSIANIQLLAWLSEREARGFLYSDNQVITLLDQECCTFTQNASGTISVFSYGEETSSVDLSGLKYCLEKAKLTNAFPLGVSNEFIGSQAKIRVKNGKLLLIFPSNCISEMHIDTESSVEAD